MIEQDGQDGPPTLSWEDKAREEQQNFLELFGNREYDSYRRRMPSICNLLLTGFCKCHEDDDGMCTNESEMVALRMKIGFALCGQPAAIPAEDNCFTGYSGHRLKLISKVFDQVVKRQHRNNVLMGIIFISLENKNDGSDNVSNFPVFRIPNPDIQEEYWFVDILGRLYNDWNDFLNNNKLYKSKCCYPKDGVYSGDSEGRVEVDFGLTPASTTTGQVVSYADTAATVGSVAAGVGMFFPPIAIPSIAACGVMSVYSTVRGSMDLADRSNHGQSLTDREAARQWLSLAGTMLSVGSAGGMAALRMMAREGRVVSSMLTGLVTGLTVSSNVANGIHIIENAMTIQEQEEWFSLQSVQLALSVFYFSHSLANFQTARSVIVETQTQVLNEHSAGLSRRQRNLFSGMQRETLNIEPDPIVGRARIIRDLNHISNKSEFFGQILRSNKQARKTDQPVKKLKFGNLFATQDAGPSQTGQTSSQNVFLRQTAAFRPLEPTHFRNVPAQRYFQQFNEPILITQIRDMCLQRIPYERLLDYLDEICGKFEYGRLCMSAIRIVFDIYNCRDESDAFYILRNMMDLWEELVKKYRLWRSQSRVSSGHESDGNDTLSEESVNQQSDVEEIMNEIVGDVDFIPEHFYHFGNIEVEEEVYHFPVDHREWGANGELTPEDYVLIAQNAFGSNSHCNIIHHGNTANVFLEHCGLVKIRSSVKKQIIVLKKFKKLE